MSAEYALVFKVVGEDIDWLIQWKEFYAVSTIFQPHNDGDC